MSQSIIIVGAGIVGAASALHLARAGRKVTVIAGGAPDATGAAFGWINASFFLDGDHHRLRVAGMAAWHRLLATVDLPVLWRGCLCWDMPPDDLARTYADLRARDYPVAWLDGAQLAELEPALAQPPEAALQFPTEGAAHSPGLSARLLHLAQGQGARVIRNVTVTALAMRGGRCLGVVTDTGNLEADQVLVAAGTGTAALCETAGHAISMVSRPAYIMRTDPAGPLLHHVLATPEGEVRQEPEGSLLMPTATGHQGDTSERLTLSPVAAAEDAMDRLRGLVRGLDDTGWSEVIRAERPVPADGLPVVGALGEGLHVATLHSGITLGPLVGELVATEMTHGPDNATSATLAPYRPDRF